MFKDTQDVNTTHKITVETIIGRHHRSVVIINNNNTIIRAMKGVHRVTIIKATTTVIHSRTTTAGQHPTLKLYIKQMSVRHRY